MILFLCRILENEILVRVAARAFFFITFLEIIGKIVGHKNILLNSVFRKS